MQVTNTSPIQSLTSFEMGGHSGIPKIMINDIKPGAYCFDSFDCKGKTRLCNAVKELQLHREQVLGYNAKDQANGLKLNRLVREVKPKVVVVDQYDRYFGEYDKLFERAKFDGTVYLIDTKLFPQFQEDGTVGISQDAESITIEVLWFEEE